MKVLTTTGLTKLIELSKGTFLDKNNVIDVSDALATVALTGSYNDLSNKPVLGSAAYANTSDFATAAEGTLADTALQPGDNISELTNDANYQTDTQVSSAISTHNSSISAHSDIRSDIASKSTVSVSATGTATDKVQYITIDGVEKKISGSEEDNVTITKNASDKIQAVGTFNKNTASGATGALYNWVGTLQEYNDQNIKTLHPDWLCYITDDIDAGESVYTKTEVDTLLGGKENVGVAYTKAESDSLLTTMLQALYPVGSIYIGTQASCPLASLISGSSWSLVAQDRSLQGSSTNHTAGSTIAAGLPNITGRFRTSGGTGSYRTIFTEISGAFYGDSSQSGRGGTSSETENGYIYLNIDASRSNSMYGNSTTVQPPAYVVNVWRRTA